MRPAGTDTETQTLPDRRLTGITTWVLVKVIRRMDVHCCYILKLPFSQDALFISCQKVVGGLDGAEWSRLTARRQRLLRTFLLPMQPNADERRLHLQLGFSSNTTD